eukprot:226608-Hanusia_phi.AAC.2
MVAACDGAVNSGGGNLEVREGERTIGGEGEVEKRGGERGEERGEEREEREDGEGRIGRRIEITSKGVRTADVIVASLVGAGHEGLRGMLQQEQLHFHTVIVDEASQAVEPSLLIPLLQGAQVDYSCHAPSRFPLLPPSSLFSFFPLLPLPSSPLMLAGPEARPHRRSLSVASDSHELGGAREVEDERSLTRSGRRGEEDWREAY